MYCCIFHPVWYRWYGSVLLCFAVLFVHQLFRRYSVEVRNDKRMRLKNLVFLIPVILVLTVPPNATTSGTLPNKNVQMLSMAGADTPDTEDISEPVPVGGSTNRTTWNNAENPGHPRQCQRIRQPRIYRRRETETSAAAVEPADALPCRLVDDTVPFDVSADMFDACIYSSATELAGADDDAIRFRLYRTILFLRIRLWSRGYISIAVPRTRRSSDFT